MPPLHNTLMRIKCPHPQCGVEITVQFTPDIIYKDIECPFCHQTAPFWKWKGWRWPAPPGWRWEGFPYPPVPEPPGGDTPQPPLPPKGQIVLLRTNQIYDFDEVLRGIDPHFDEKVLPKRISVGRMPKNGEPKADILIPDVLDNRRMSRKHLEIELRNESGIYHFYARLAVAEVNKSFINGKLLVYGQDFLLHSGDIINLPNELLRFEIIDNNRTGEETELAFR